MNPRRLHWLLAFLLALGFSRGVSAQVINLFPDEVPNGLQAGSGKRFHQRFDVQLTSNPGQSSRGLTITLPSELVFVPLSVTATSTNAAVSTYFCCNPTGQTLAFGWTNAVALGGETITIEFDLTTPTNFTGVAEGAREDTSYIFDFSADANQTDTDVPVSKFQNRPIRAISFAAPDSATGDTTSAGGRFFKLAFPSSLPDYSHTGLAGQSVSATFTDNQTDVIYSFYVSTDSSLIARTLEMAPLQFFNLRADETTGSSPLLGTRQNPRVVPSTFIRENFTTIFSSVTADSITGMVSLSGTSDNSVYYVYVLADPGPGTIPSNRQFGGSAKKGFDQTTLGAFTGGVFLGRSGPLLVQHPPEFVVVGWDYDDDTGDDFDNTGVIQVPSDIIGMVAIDANRKDNRNITLDSGAFFEKGAAFVSLNSGLTPSPTTFVELLWLAQDDDNPSDFEMRIFLSTTGGLTVADLVGTGLDSLSNSIVVAGSDTLSIENRKILFVALERDSLTNLVTSFTPRGDYFVYFAATDGNDDHRILTQVSNDPFIASPTASVLSVRHAPNLSVDNFSLNDFDGTGDGDLDVITGIDVSQMFIDADGKDLNLGPAQRAITVSWGEPGLPGDSDIDDDATIEVYFSTRSDFQDVRGSIEYTSGNSNGDDLLATISQGNSDTHRIGQTREDPDGQFDNQLTWDLWSYVSPEGTVPRTGVRYFFFARMIGGTTTRLISLTRFGALDVTGTPMAASILHPPFIRPIEPARDIAVTMDEPVLISWQAVDVDNQEADGLVAVPANTSGRISPNSDTASPNIRVLLTSVDWGVVTTWGSITDFTAATGNVDRFWVGNSGDGSLVEEIELNEGVDSSFVLLGNRMRNNLFSTITGTTTPLSTGSLELQTNQGAGETYFVYLAIDDGRDGTVADAVVGGTSNTRNFGAFSPLVRAPGTITFTGIVPTNPPTTTRFIVPSRMQTIMGEVIQYPIIPDVSIPSKQINVVDIFISMDADKFEAVDQDASIAGIQPFSLGDASGINAGNVQQSAIVQGDKVLLDFIYTDVTNGLTFFNAEEPLAFANVRTKIVPDSATVSTSITLDNSGNRITKMLDSVNVNVSAFVPQPTSVILNRRTQISGKVPLQGRTSSADLVTFMLRPVGSYESLPDSLFELNDVDPIRFGVQVISTDFDGKFTLVNVPSGIFVLSAAVQRHLSGHDTIYVRPGLDITDLLPTRDGDGVQRVALLAGDAAGFEDSTGASLPDNAIGNPDVNAINAAIFSQPGDTNFDAFADINRDNIVNATDKDFATANQTDNTGTVGRIRPVFPVFKGAGRTTDNREAIVTLADLPNREIRAGEAFDVTVQVSGARAVRTYEVHLGFDSTKVAVEGLSSHGSFLGNYLSDMVVRVFDGEVGLANSIIGLTPVGASGEGTLGTIRFRALKRSTETHLKLNSAVLIDVDHVGVSPKVNGEATIVFSKDPIVYHDAEGKEIRGLIIPEVDPKVDFNDFMVLVEAFGSNVGSSAFDVRADLNADDRVDFSDFLIFTFDFGKIAVDAPASARLHKPPAPAGVNGAARMSLKLEEGSKDGQLVRLTAGLSRARALQGWGLTLRYDPSRFEFLEAVRPEEDLLEVAGASAPLLLVHQEGAGEVTLAGAISRGTAASGTGDLAVLIFRSRAASTQDARFELYEGVLFDPDHLPNLAHAAQKLEIQQALIQQTRSGRFIRSMNLESGIFSSP